MAAKKAQTEDKVEEVEQSAPPKNKDGLIPNQIIDDKTYREIMAKQRAKQEG